MYVRIFQRSKIRTFFYIYKYFSIQTEEFNITRTIDQTSLPTDYGDAGKRLRTRQSRMKRYLLYTYIIRNAPTRVRVRHVQRDLVEILWKAGEPARAQTTEKSYRGDKRTRGHTTPGKDATGARRSRGGTKEAGATP